MLRNLFSCMISLLFCNIVFAQSIAEAEYYFDTEPGVGMATTLTIPNNTAEVNTTYDIDISGLDVGFHVLYFRTKDTNNVWSLYDKRSFFVNKAFTTTNEKITEVEYYFDTEVGVDKGTKLTLNDNNTQFSDTFLIDVTGLNPGFHTLHIRLKSEKGVWSLYDKRTFFVTAQNTNNFSKITKAEYYFDNEVGVGNGTALEIAKDSTAVNEIFDIDIDSLSPGFHTLNLRVLNAENTWSLYDKRTFYVTAQNTNVLSKISKAEYFFDQEVGLGNGTSLALSKDSITVKEAFKIDVASLSVGFHTFNLRVMNVENVWSLLDKRTFYISESFSNTASKISKAEYYFNDFVANGRATEIPLPDDFTGSFETEIETSGLTEGEHLLFVRVQNEAGIWSLYDVVAFDIDNSLSTEDISNQVGVFPNPTSNYINLRTNLQLERYQLYDVSGKVIMKNTLISKRIPTASLSKGVYFLVLQSEKGRIVKKIVKE